ncbi:MAG TPA: threonyl-tRNA synthetase editing domain-containing protein [Candidatus Binatia bacterium]|nr:threonyl-tRNA synthetase editing domain-containing protein [Candidatus Binatia bacterium]
MKLLCFQAKRFHWKTHTKSLAEVADRDAEEEVVDTVVVFVHAEKSDTEANRKAAILRQTLKHIKWLANKRNFKTIVIHSFTHLGAETASADFAEALIETVAERLRENGYSVRTTPFGYFCEWDLSVYGDSLAKVWKEIH